MFGQNNRLFLSDINREIILPATRKQQNTCN